MELPENIIRILVGLILGAVISALVTVVIIRKRRGVSCEVWIPLLALCCLTAIGCSAVALCLAAAFVMAD